MENTYEIVFFRITSFFREKDILFSQTISQSKHISLNQMGLPEQFGIRLADAVNVKPLL